MRGVDIAGLCHRPSWGTDSRCVLGPVLDSFPRKLFPGTSGCVSVS